MSQSNKCQVKLDIPLKVFISLFILTCLDIVTLRMIGILNNQYIAKVEEHQKDYDFISIEVCQMFNHFYQTFVSISILRTFMNEKHYEVI